MKNILIILTITIVTSCGMGGPLDFLKKDEVFEDPRDVLTTDSEFISLKAEFERDYRNITGKSINTAGIPINFGDVGGGNTVGICTTWSNTPYKEIKINLNYWNSTTDYCRKSLIYHELGHCALGRGHDNETHRGVKLYE